MIITLVSATYGQHTLLQIGQDFHFLVVMQVDGNRIKWRPAVQSVNAVWREADDTAVVLHGFINNFIIVGVRNMTTRQNKWRWLTFRLAS